MELLYPILPSLTRVFFYCFILLFYSYLTCGPYPIGRDLFSIGLTHLLSTETFPMWFWSEYTFPPRQIRTVLAQSCYIYKHNPDQYPDNAHIVAGGFNRASLNAVNFHLHITGSKRAERAVTAAILNPRTATRSNPSLHQASRHFLASKLQTVEAGTPANVSCETLVNPTLGHASGHITWRKGMG